MTTQQIILFAALAGTLALFIWGRFRYDVVALLALLALAVVGIVPTDRVFTGFSHPAVITVAAVLVLSRALQNSGIIDAIARVITRVGDGRSAQVGAISSVTAVCSGFINNIGALALFMPVGVRMARAAKRSPSYILMPAAFASLLGGLTTLIGSPPNIIIATFRADEVGEPFRMFDFTPVGAGVAVAGVAFIALIGWRLIPNRTGQASREELFKIEEYVAEASVPAKSKLVNKPVREVGAMTKGEALVVGIVRAGARMPAPASHEVIHEGDVLVIEAEPEALRAVVEGAGLEFIGDVPEKEASLRSDEIALIEAVVTPDSPIDGRTLRAINARWRFGVNVLAVARQGARLTRRLADTRLRAGDILLLQAREDTVADSLRAMGCLPLAERNLRIGQQRRVWLALGIFIAAVALTATGALPAPIALAVGALAMVMVGMVSLRDAYDSVDWPIIVLLGAMIPVGQALETTGGAALVADALRWVAGGAPAFVALGLLMIVTMTLSDAINNAATAVLMAPVAVGMAHANGASVDPYLMTVALGSSAAFLTPIGHQSNTLVMGPGGYRFGDYWRLGIPLSVIYMVVGVSLIMVVWPF